MAQHQRAAQHAIAQRDRKAHDAERKDRGGGIVEQDPEGGVDGSDEKAFDQQAHPADGQRGATYGAYEQKNGQVDRCEEAELPPCRAYGEQRGEVACMFMQIQRIHRALREHGKRKQNGCEPLVLSLDLRSAQVRKNILLQPIVSVRRLDLRQNILQLPVHLHKSHGIPLEIHLRRRIHEQHRLFLDIDLRIGFKNSKKGDLIRRDVFHAYRVATLCEMQKLLLIAIHIAVVQNGHRKRQRNRKHHHKKQKQLFARISRKDAAEI